MKRGRPEKYFALAGQIRQLIRERRLGQDDKLPSERELARILAASHLTVRKALEVLQEQGVIHKLPGRGSFVGRRRPERKQTPLVGILFPEREVFFFDILAELESKLHVSNLDPVVHLTYGCPEKETSILARFIELGVTGILAAPNPACAATYREIGVPVVFFDTWIPGLSVPHITTDDSRGAREAVEHLIALGHRRIAHIGAAGDATSEQRLAGYREAFRRHDMPVDAGWVKQKDYSREWGYYAARELFERATRPTAVFCGNDTIAAGVFQYLREHGLSCPDDLSIVGFGNTAVGRDLALSTVNQSCSAMANAIWTTFKALRQGRHPVSDTTIGTELIVRRTSAAPVHRG
ncbi:MAG: GntR family transcriptional regulator [Kiritimatiellae bacterium]|nr:GntR family transcriptional regulator [Kiritimatiellia bacterium]